MAAPTTHVSKIHPSKDCGGADRISDILAFGRLWYSGPNAANNAIGYAKHSSRSHGALIRVCDAFGLMVETNEHARDFTEP